MTGLGFNEVINYSFVGERSCDLLELAPDDRRLATVERLDPDVFGVQGEDPAHLSAGHAAELGNDHLHHE